MKSFFVWIAMWMADIIPWVSGWTIAFISWIYDRLIESISRVDAEFFWYILTWHIKKAWIYIHGWFLSQVFGGIFLAIVTLAHLMEYLLIAYPVLVYAFFLWLILASIVLIWKHLPQQKTPTLYAMLFVWALLWYIATSSFNLDPTDHSTLSIFVAWMFGSMAMILPGISGSYILVILGKYTYILWLITQQTDILKTALQTWNYSPLFWETLTKIGIFIAWIACGLLGFSKLLNWLLKHYKHETIATLIWCMIGALHIVWPWTATSWINTYFKWLPFVIIGASIILGLEKLAKRNKEEKKWNI